jgi:hydroxymethylbilane synthase
MKVVGTRGSDLALFQARSFLKTLSSISIEAKESILVTKGDVDHRPFKELGGDGYFTKEIEAALIRGDIDFAVHSGKDLPSMVHFGFPWVAFGERETTTDILIIKKEFFPDGKIKEGSRIGTSSPRRREQLRFFFKSLDILELRGNVPTRLKKCLDGEYDGIVLAKAGLSRLGLIKDIPSSHLIVDLDWTTAPAQGIVVAQHSSKVENTGFANQELTKIALFEKSFLKFLGGGCQMPLGCNFRLKKEVQASVFFKEKDMTFNFHVNGKTIETARQSAFEKLVNFEAKPSQKKVWVAAPLQNQREWGKEITKRGYHPVFFPLIDIVPDSTDLKSIDSDLEKSSALVFTSAFGARLALLEVGQKIMDFAKSKPILVVGDSTKACFDNVGISTIAPHEATGEALANMILKMNLKSVLALGAERLQMAGSLRDLKIPFTHRILYKTAYVSWDSLPLEPSSDDDLIVTSPSSVESLLDVTKR